MVISVKQEFFNDEGKKIPPGVYFATPFIRENIADGNEEEMFFLDKLGVGVSHLLLKILKFDQKIETDAVL